MKKAIFICLFIISLSLTACSEKNDLELSGTIEATQIDINSEVNGKIVQVLLDEGNLVHKDDVIALIDSQPYEIQVKKSQAAVKGAEAALEEIKNGTRPQQLDKAEAEVNVAKAKLDEAKNGARPEEISKVKALYQQASDAVDSAQTNYDYRNSNLERQKELFNTEVVSEQQVDDAKNAFDQAKQQLINARDNLNVSKAQLDLVESGSTDEAILVAQSNYESALAQYGLLKEGSTPQSIKAAEANVEQLQAALDSANLQLEKCTIKSPVDGILLNKAIDVGQVVTSGTNIISVQENREYWIKVYVPQKYNSRVKLSQKVIVRSSALPDTDITGTIIYKSPKAEFTPKNIETTEAKENDTVIAIKVRLDSNTSDLSAGMIANVIIGAD
nr:HlyD family efflux transporter periplasmic adaptor subunit [Sedimentibacter sp.]